jgi:hypothetical protein
MQFIVDKRHQLVAGVFLTIAPSFEQLCDACGRTGRHSFISFCLAKPECEWAIARRPRLALILTFENI